MIILSKKNVSVRHQLLGPADNPSSVVSRHRQIMNLETKMPTIAHDSWVAPNATVIGQVELGNDSSVWYGSVVRGMFKLFNE